MSTPRQPIPLSDSGVLRSKGGVAPAEAMDGLLSRLADEYGSVDAYLDAIGVDSELRARLALTLTEPIAE